MELFYWLFGKRTSTPSQQARAAESDETAAAIECAACGSLFEWLRAYWQEQTPGARNRLVGDTIPRAFCPHCGEVVSEADDRGSWHWVGRNGSLNSSKSQPPSPFWFSSGDDPWLKRKLPAAAVVRYSETRVDLSLVEPVKSAPAPSTVGPADAEFVTKCLISDRSDESVYLYSCYVAEGAGLNPLV